MNTFSIDFSSIGDIEVYKTLGIFDLNGNSKEEHIEQYATSLQKIIGTTYVPPDRGWSVFERTFNITALDISFNNDVASSLVVAQYHNLKPGFRLKLQSPSSILTTDDFNNFMGIVSGFLENAIGKEVEYKGNTIAVSINQVEIWNEPDLGNWTGTNEEFGSFLASACQTLKAQYPSIKFGGCSFGSPNVYEMMEAYASSCSSIGYEPEFISFHMYHQYPTVYEEFAPHDIFKSYFVTSPETWLSEWNINFAAENGVPFTPKPDVDNYKGASYLLTTILTCLKAGVDRQNYFYLQDRSHPNNQPITSGHQEYSGRSVGLFTLFNAPKSNWFALKKLVEVLKYGTCPVTRTWTSNNVTVSTNVGQIETFNLSGEWTTQCFATRQDNDGYIVITNVGNNKTDSPAFEQALAYIRVRNNITTLGELLIAIGDGVLPGGTDAQKNIAGAGQVLDFYTDVLWLNDLFSGVSAGTYLTNNPFTDNELVHNKAILKEAQASNGVEKDISITFSNDKPIYIEEEYLFASGSNDPATMGGWLASTVGDVTGYYSVTGTYPIGLGSKEAINARINAFENMKLNTVRPSRNTIATLRDNILYVTLPAWSSIILKVKFAPRSGPNPSFGESPTAPHNLFRRIGQYFKDA